MSEVRVGCSGWSYRHWKKGVFYPEGLRGRDELAFYASRFDTAELNGTFYRLPTEQAVIGWRETAPPGFVFAWKASRFLTHMKRLLDPDEPLALMFGRTDLLGGKLGPILFQLPPQMTRNDERLDALLARLPASRRYAFEFRHPSWYADEVFAMLEARDCALVVSDHHHAPAPWRATASFAYVRGHGPEGRYWGRYPDATLEDWARRIRIWREQGRDVFCYFDNDPEGSAPRDAEAIIALLDRCGAEPRSVRPSRPAA
jgi:uncharacterized protein YecE (DUF72 family)